MKKYDIDPLVIIDDLLCRKIIVNFETYTQYDALVRDGVAFSELSFKDDALHVKEIPRGEVVVFDSMQKIPLKSTKPKKPFYRDLEKKSKRNEES